MSDNLNNEPQVYKVKTFSIGTQSYEIKDSKAYNRVNFNTSTGKLEFFTRDQAETDTVLNGNAVDPFGVNISIAKDGDIVKCTNSSTKQFSTVQSATGNNKVLLTKSYNSTTESYDESWEDPIVKYDSWSMMTSGLSSLTPGRLFSVNSLP